MIRAEFHRGVYVSAAALVLAAMVGMSMFAWLALEKRPTDVESVMLFTGPILLLGVGCGWSVGYSRVHRSWTHPMAREYIVLSWFVFILIIPAIHASVVYHILHY